SEVTVQHATPVVDILGAKRLVESIEMPQRDDIRGAGAFAEHLLDRIAGHEVDEQKDNRHHKPEHGQRVGEARQQRDEEPAHQRVFSAAGLSCSILTLLMGRPLISSTVMRRPSYSMLSPPSGILPRRVSRKPASVSTLFSRGSFQRICVSRSRRLTLPSSTI